MIGRMVRFGALFFITVTVLLWGALQFPSVQRYACSTLSKTLSETTHYNVTIDSLHGLLPFFVGADSITVSEKDKKVLSIDSIDLIPNWFEIVFGKISFLYATANGVDLTHLKTASASQSEQRTPSVSLYAVRLSHVKVPKAYYEPLLTSRAKESQVSCHFTVSGRLFWHASNQKLSATLNIMPYADELSFGSLQTKVTIKPTLTKISAALELAKIPQGSVFLTLPIDRLELSGDLEGKTFSQLSGTWQAKGLVRSQPHVAFAPFMRVLAEGNVEASNLKSLSFATDNLRVEQVEPLRQPKKSPEGTFTATEIQAPASLKGSVSIDNEELLINLTASSLEVDEYKIPTSALHFSATPQKEGYSGLLKADVTIQKGQKRLPVTFACTYHSRAETQWDFDDVALSLADHTISGSLQVALFPFVMRGKLESLSDDQSELSDFFGIHGGKAHVLLSFEPGAADDLSWLTQKATFRAEVSKIQTHDLFCKKAYLHVDANGLLESPNVTLQLGAAGVQTPHLTLEEVLLSSEHDFSHQEQDIPYKLTVRGASDRGPLGLQSEGTCTSSSLSLHTFQATSSGYTLKAASPIHLKHLPAGFSLSPFELHSEEHFRLFGEGQMSEKGAFLRLTCEQFPLEFFNIPFFGRVSGQLELNGTNAQPRIECSLASGSLCLWDPKTKSAPPLIASSQIELYDGVLKVYGELQGLSLKKPTLFDMHVPLQLSLVPFSYSIPEKGNLSAILESEFDLNTLLSSYFDGEELCEGVVQVDAKLKGTPANPSLTGSVCWSEGKLIIPPLGSTFSNIQMAARLENSQLQIEKLEATDGLSGKLEASGFLDRAANFELQSTLTDFVAINLDNATACIAGTLTLSGNMNEASLKGALDVNEASLTLSKDLSGDLPKLDITYVTDEEKADFHKNDAFGFGLDLDLNLAKGHIQGLGLDSEWKGKTHLTRKNDELGLHGQVELTAGQLQFGGKAFALTQGQIDFHGNLYTKSALNVVAINESGSVSTQITLQGSLDSPRIALQSNPPMSQKEILSWILFNKSSSEISPMQGLQLGQMLLKLNGAASNFDILEKIKEILHLDRIDFGSQTGVGPQQEAIPNEVSVQVGKYISDGVIVTLSKDVTNETNRVGVEANLTKHITAQATVGDDAETQLSLEWKMKY